MVDLTKAFEMVRLDLVWRAGLRLYLHPLVLGLMLESFAFARVITAQCLVTDPAHTLSAILAGGSFATDALFMVFMGKCDDLLVMHWTAELCLFVDDLTIHVTGTENHVADELTATVDDCIFMLEDELGLRVSRGRHGEFDDEAKSVAVASTPTLEAKLQPRLKRHGIQTKCKVKFLGIDYCGGRAFRREVQRHRMDTVASRAHRMRQCGRKAARHLLPLHRVD